MHALENFEDLSVPGHGQRLGAEAEAEDFKNVPEAKDMCLRTPSLLKTITWLVQTNQTTADKSLNKHKIKRLTCTQTDTNETKVFFRVF